MTKQRITKDELVELVFQLFQAQMHALGEPCIQRFVIPLDTIREALASRSGTPRQNSRWIFTQIRKYEAREGVRLFDRTKDRNGNDALRVTENLLTFVQKRHLYRSEKIRLANGVADFVQNEIAATGQRSELFLGAGTTVAYLAEVFRGRAAGSDLRLDITTHNMGVIKALTDPNLSGERVRLTVQPGRFDPTTLHAASDRTVRARAGVRLGGTRRVGGLRWSGVHRIGTRACVQAGRSWPDTVVASFWC